MILDGIGVILVIVYSVAKAYGFIKRKYAKMVLTLTEASTRRE